MIKDYKNKQEKECGCNKLGGFCPKKSEEKKETHPMSDSIKKKDKGE